MYELVSVSESSQNRPVKPGAQRQLPSNGSQRASCSQPHTWRHSTPYVPCTHGVWQSAPLQPGGHRQRPSTASHSGSRSHSSNERFAERDSSPFPTAEPESKRLSRAFQLERAGLRRLLFAAMTSCQSSSGSIAARASC